MKIKIIPFGDYKVERKHYNDAGADIYIQSDINIKPNETVKIPAGFGIELPDAHVAFVLPRSSIAAQGLHVHSVPIDSGYRGNIHIIATNISGKLLQFKKGDRLGQLVIQPCMIADFAENLGEERGTGAFGSTGK